MVIPVVVAVVVAVVELTADFPAGKFHAVDVRVGPAGADQVEDFRPFGWSRDTVRRLRLDVSRGERSCGSWPLRRSPVLEFSVHSGVVALGDGLAAESHNHRTMPPEFWG